MGVMDLNAPIGALDQLSSESTTDLLRPVLRQFPDLDPDRDSD